jgi:hypothetical protein
MGPAFDARATAAFGEEIAIEGIVGIGKEHPPAAIATLGDMMGKPRNDDARQPCH